MTSVQGHKHHRHSRLRCHGDGHTIRPHPLNGGCGPECLPQGDTADDSEGVPCYGEARAGNSHHRIIRDCMWGGVREGIGGGGGGEGGSDHEGRGRRSHNLPTTLIDVTAEPGSL